MSYVVSKPTFVLEVELDGNVHVSYRVAKRTEYVGYLSLVGEDEYTADAELVDWINEMWDEKQVFYDHEALSFYWWVRYLRETQEILEGE